MKLQPRDTQTQVKHTILAQYLDIWGGIILNPKMRNRAKQKLSSGQRFDPHFVYVDCFASCGRYVGDKHRSNDMVEGSPLIGIRMLDKLAESARNDGFSIRVNSILIEKDTKIYQGLQETLSIYGYSGRAKDTTDFAQLKSGEIAVLNADSTTLVDKLVAYTTSGFTWAFYLLDPYGAGIPYNFVRPIVRQDHHDVMINFIYEDLSRKAGMARSDKVGSQQREQVESWSAVFGDETWKDIERHVRLNPQDDRWQMSSDGDTENTTGLSEVIVSKHVERELVSHYKSVLKGMDPNLAVKLVDLQFPDKERTMFYLFLTTHDPTGALWLNKILYDAKLLEYEIRNVRRLSKQIERSGQLTLIPVEEQIAKPNPLPRSSIEVIASDILQRFAGKSATRRDIYRELVDEEYFPNEVMKALNLLKKRGKAQFEGILSHDKPIIRFSRSKTL